MRTYVVLEFCKRDQARIFMLGPRIHLDGVPLHIVQRGHNRESCFFGEGDYQAIFPGWASRYERLAVYRELFRTQLDGKAVDDIRLALNQNQPLGNSGFNARIEATTGQRREARPRGRPPTRDDASLAPDGAQAELGL